jgi:hypothetical protein
MLRSLWRRARRDPLGAARQVWTRLRDDPVWVVLKIDAALPAGRRAALHARLRRIRLGAGRWRSLLALVPAAVSGDATAIEERLQVRDPRAASRERAWIGRLLVHTEHPERALTWLGANDDPQAATARGLALGVWRFPTTSSPAASRHRSPRVPETGTASLLPGLLGTESAMMNGALRA